MPSYESFEPTRYAMGDTLAVARRVDLISMKPREVLSSTGFALADPNEQYVVLQPAEAGQQPRATG